MKDRVLIKDLAQFEGQEVQLKGWVCQFRSSGKISFLSLRDGTGECQCVFSQELCEPESFRLFSEVRLEALVQVWGQARQWRQNFEVSVKRFKILSESKDYPIAKKAHGVDFLLSHRHLWLRSKKQRAILSIRSEIIKNIHGFFQKEGFIQVDAPILMPTACEASSSLFSVDFFGQKEVFLSQSGQLHMEAASAALGRVYCFGPTFRAEKSSTRRHLLEFWMIEPEMAFCSYEEAMSLAENLVEYVVQNTLQNSGESLALLGRVVEGLKKVKAPFPRLSYQEAGALLKAKKSGFEQGKDLGAREESLLSEDFEKPVFVHHYPKNIKAFYMKEDPKDPSLSLSFDLLATEAYGELIGGSQRGGQQGDFNKKYETARSGGKFFRMVSGSEALWELSPLRFWFGFGKTCLLDLWFGSYPGGHSLSPPLWPLFF